MLSEITDIITAVAALIGSYAALIAARSSARDKGPKRRANRTRKR